MPYEPFLLGVGVVLNLLIHEPLPSNPSAQATFYLNPSPGQKTLEKQGEERFSRSMFAFRGGGGGRIKYIHPHLLPGAGAVLKRAGGLKFVLRGFKS